MARVLLADGDPSVRQALRGALESAGHVVREHVRSVEALEAARSDPPDVVLAEIDLPDAAPFELLRAIGPSQSTRLLVVSARSAEVDRVVAFELGADDYVTKPFSSREVVLRVAAVLRREGGSTTQTIGSVTIDRAAARVLVEGRIVGLTRLELAVLLDLVDAAGAVRSRAQLLHDALSVNDDTTERAIDSHVKRLRAKLGPAAGIVETVKGVGYRLAVKGGESER